MRPIWSGTISFILVNIPVRLYSAISAETINFDLLHEHDMSRIRYVRICEAEQKEVPYDEIVRGYEYQKNQYVIITPDDFRKADPKKTYSINILDFVSSREIDPIYYEKSYYLEPDRGGARSYELLRLALQKSGKVAVGKFILREREHLVLVRPLGNLLILNQIRFAEQIRRPEGLNIEPSQISEEELALALDLINAHSHPFDAQKYKDDYIVILQEIIANKIGGREAVTAASPPVPTHVDELMRKLKESLAESEKAATK